MKSIYACTAAILTILAGAAVFRPQVMKAGPGSVTAPKSTVAPAATPTQKMHWAEKYGKLPLSFEANQGQTDSHVKFLSRGHGYALFLTGDEAVLALKKSSVVSGQSSVADHGLPSVTSGPLPGIAKAGRRTTDNGPRTTDSILRMKLLGANAHAAVTGADELPGKSNYFIGNDRKQWRTNVPTYAKVKYQNVYPGVDLVYYGNQGGQLEYDFVVAPGADPSAIALDVGTVGEPPTVAAGSSRHPDVGAGLVPAQGRPQGSPLRIDSNGDLVVKIDGGAVRFHKPVVYQEQETGDRSQEPGAKNEDRNSKLEIPSSGNHQSPIANRKFLNGQYVLQADNRVGFKVPSYDHSRPLVIDPVLLYSTYLGGSKQDLGYGIAVDSSGSAYVVGFTASLNFPTASPLQAACGGGSLDCGNAFVSKLNAAGSALVYSTYLGGSTAEYGLAIAIDTSGNAYVAGETFSTNFPTVNPVQATNHGHSDVIVAMLNPTGSALVYSTYLGGSEYDIAKGIAVDNAGNAYIAGSTSSRDFPTAHPYQATNNAIPNRGTAFVAKLNFNATSTPPLTLVYSTFLGGSGGDSANAIAIDTSGNTYLTGSTASTDFPTVNPLQATNNATPNATAFVAELNSTGSGLVYSTYLGGSLSELGNSIAVDTSDNAYVTGQTYSANFPTVNPYQAACGTCTISNPTAFVSKLNAGGSALVYSTYLGGTSGDGGQGIAVDLLGNTYVTGQTTSSDFPTVNPVQPDFICCSNAFVTEFNPAGSALVYSTSLGGGGDIGSAIAVDSSGNTYVTGFTYSTIFPTVNPLQASYGGGFDDAFVVKLSPGGLPVVSLSPASLLFGPQDVGTTSGSKKVTLTNTGNATLAVSSLVVSGDFSQTTGAGSCPAAPFNLGIGASCEIYVTFTPTQVLTRTGDITLTDNASPPMQSVALSGPGILPLVCLPSSLIFPSTVEFTMSPTQTVMCANTQSTSVTFSSITTNLADFGITNSGTCSTLTPLAPGGHCSIVISFTPSVLGVESGTLSIIDSANSQSVTLSGRGNP